MNGLFLEDTINETELRWFGFLKNTTQLSDFKYDVLEQWSIRTDETKKKGIKGEIRVRSIKTDSETKYVLTIKKSTSDSNTKKETEIDIDSYTFNAMKELAVSGFKKKRYYIPVDDKLKFELDVFSENNKENFFCLELELPEKIKDIPNPPKLYYNQIKNEKEFDKKDFYMEKVKIKNNDNITPINF